MVLPWGITPTSVGTKIGLSGSSHSSSERHSSASSRVSVTRTPHASRVSFTRFVTTTAVVDPTAMTFGSVRSASVALGPSRLRVEPCSFGFSEREAEGDSGSRNAL